MLAQSAPKSAPMPKKRKAVTAFVKGRSSGVKPGKASGSDKDKGEPARKKAKGSKKPRSAFTLADDVSVCVDPTT